MDAEDPRHGTVNGYNNLDCRCDPCRAAHRDEHWKWMQAHPEQQAKHRLRARLHRTPPA